MSTTTYPDSVDVSKTSELPPLRAGDHLDQETFHRRYAAMPSNFRAELVKGVVIVPSPLYCPHGHTHARIIGWLFQFQAMTAGTALFDNTSTRIDSENELQPDAQLIILPEYGGQGVTLGKCVEGAPQLVIEVAASSESYDLYEKFEVYQQAGVKEYLVVTTTERQVRWFASVDGKFTPLAADHQGWFRSGYFPGLWLDAAALFADHPTGLLTALQAGLADPSHAEFVERLAAHHAAFVAKST